MFIETSRSTWLKVLVAAAATSCATVAPPPTELPEVRPGYVAGYLQPNELPDSRALVPPPPPPGSAALAADEDAYKSTRSLRDTARWGRAALDADLTFPNAAQVFSCTLSMPISAQSTPHLNMLLRRIRMDASRANDKAKDSYKRTRPYKVYGDANCTPREQLRDDSYPSGHSSIGWAWALVLAEIAPDRADALFARGLAFGQSRVICGVHWKSDVEAGRLVGASTVSRLHANPVFTAQLAEARKEIEAARAAGLESPLDCTAEAQALEIGR